MKKWILIFGFMFLSSNTQAANTCTEGTLNISCWDCGKTQSDLCTAVKTGTTLTVTGSGQMKNYDCEGSNSAPWGRDLTSVDILGVTSIGRYAFYANLQLTSLNIASSVQTIGSQALSDLYSLKSLEIPDSVTSVGYGAFGWSIGGLESIKLSNSLTSLPTHLFANDNKLKTIVIPDSVTSMSEDAFENSSVSALYCSETQQNLCQTALQNAGKTEEQIKSILKTYEKYGDVFLFDGKFYANPSDIGTKNNIKKRIYTIKEAEKLSKETDNTIKIRYK